MEEFVSRAKDIASQIASRTQTRRELEAYNQGQQYLTSLIYKTGPMMTDALNQSKDVFGISRFDRNNQLVL